MTLAEVILAIIGSNVVQYLVTAWIGRNKTRAETNHTIVDTASDAIAMVKGAHGERIAELERDKTEVRKEIEVSKQQIISLNRQHGELRLALETQSRVIMELHTQISGQDDQIMLWRSRVSELLVVLRERQIPLPEWAAIG